MLALRSGLFFILMLVSTLLTAAIVVLLFFLPYRVRYAIAAQWVKLVLASLKGLCGLSHRVEGAQNIPEKPCIVFSKHQSAWETVALQSVFSPQTWVLKRELLWVPFFGWALAVMGGIAIDRSSGRKAVQQIVEKGRAQLDKGRWVVIFPEGTRVAPGQERRFGIGGAVLAEKSGYPVVPVAHNAGEFWRRRGFIKYPGVITLVVGPPIETEGKSAGQINAEAKEWMDQEMARISAPSQ